MKNNKFRIKNIDLSLLRKILKNEKDTIAHRLDENHIKYLEFYNNTNFKNLSFVFETKDNKIICPLTMHTNQQDVNFLSFYNLPIQFFSNKNIEKETLFLLVDYFDKLKKKLNVEKVPFKMKTSEEEMKLLDKKKLLNITDEIYVDLSQDLKKIEENFSQSLRRKLRFDNKSLKFTIIDKNDYQNNEILKMRDLHIFVSQRETRTLQSWQQNEKMILEGNGFLVKLEYKGRIISYMFFSFNSTVALYFSAATIRDYFKTLNNITHKGMYLAIKYLKNKSKFLYIGPQTLYGVPSHRLDSKNLLSEKEKNIERFKKSFLPKRKNLYKTYIDISYSMS
tara:strand:- start:384 stop:1391 length:1008 start_codon:yes stop_codon:yes gene_type:complete